MSRSPIFLFGSLLIVWMILSGCATPLPPTYETAGSGPVLDGPVLAVAGEKGLVAAVNNDGLFLKEDDGPWVKQEAPGISKWSKVTCLALDRGTIYLGSDGEGLHILSDGTWEVRTSRYGGLADEGVLSIAIDREGEGLPGSTLWVGTREGIAARHEGDWKVYTPDGDWLVCMTAGSASGTGKVYVSPGFRLGKKGGDSALFKPPVSAISVGPDRVVFGNQRSRLAVVSENAVAVLKISEDLKVTHLVVDPEVIWAGTDIGLLWGGLRDRAEGKPWPINSSYFGWSGTLFGSRDTREFEYRWKTVGYNTALIVGLERMGQDIWVAHRSNGNEVSLLTDRHSGDTYESITEPIMDIRRYVNIKEYITHRQKIQYESYGLSSGIKGEPNNLYVAPDGHRVWVGTTKGLWELETY